MTLTGKPPQHSTYNTDSFFWTSDETASYECAIDVVETGQPCGKGKEGSWKTPTLSEGEHTFYLFATDINGNKAEPLKYTWKIGKCCLFVINNMDSMRNFVGCCP